MQFESNKSPVELTIRHDSSISFKLFVYCRFVVENILLMEGNLIVNCTIDRLIVGHTVFRVPCSLFISQLFINNQIGQYFNRIFVRLYWQYLFHEMRLFTLTI